MEANGKSSAVDALEWMDWPDVVHGDIYSYLILMPGMTHEQLKAYKSLEGYNQFVNGWVSGVSVLIVPHSRPRVYLFTATVKHSQALSASPLKVWCGTKQSGEILLCPLHMHGRIR